jgi:hypothetical protein
MDGGSDGFMPLASGSAVGGRMGTASADAGPAVDLRGDLDNAGPLGSDSGTGSGATAGGGLSRRHAPYRPVASYADDHLNDLPLLEGEAATTSRPPVGWGWDEMGVLVGRRPTLRGGGGGAR